jgi:hypothetical protein
MLCGTILLPEIVLTQDPNKDGTNMSIKVGDVVKHRVREDCRNGKVRWLSLGGKHGNVLWPNGETGNYFLINLEPDVAEAPKVEPLKQLTTNQSAFLATLAVQGPEHGVRTNALGTFMGCSPSAAANVGLELRSLNMVVSINDNSQYNLWKFTEYGRAFVAEQARRKVQPKSKPERWILWSPESAKPPKVEYSCELEAMGVAKSMAKRYPGQQFLCCQIHTGFKQVKVRREVIKVVEDVKMEQV